MATQIYLGMPPEDIKKWIRAEAERKYQEQLATPLYFTAEQDNSSIKLVCFDSTVNDYIGDYCDSWCEFQYSTDGMKSWKDYPQEANSEKSEIKLDDCENKTVYFRAKHGNVDENPNRLGFSKDAGYTSYIYHYFEMEGSIKAGGNIQFLLENTGTKMDVPDLCYLKIFSKCTSLTQAPLLPATTLAYRCYYYMFSDCESLTKVPELPSTTLVDGCYSGMFYWCTSLTKAPALPATTLVDWCYYSMFQGCASLTQAPTLPATVLTSYCYSHMFDGCKALVQVPELPAKTLASSCYEYMFNNCISMTQAPALPATSLASSCYRGMFNKCTSLVQAPELPAKSLWYSCYNVMFERCKSLNFINVNFSVWDLSYAKYATDNWLNGVASGGTFICPATLPDTPRDKSHIPASWTRIDK